MNYHMLISILTPCVSKVWCSLFCVHLNVGSIGIFISLFEVIPKSSLGKWWLDFLYPEGDSVKNHISKARCSSSFVTIKDAVEVKIKKGRGAWLVKVGVRNV